MYSALKNVTLQRQVVTMELIMLHISKNRSIVVT